jgi:hypothetical protein
MCELYSMVERVLRSANALCLGRPRGGGTCCCIALCSTIFVSMADKGVGARIAGAAAFVSMADKGACARIVGAAAFVSMAD